MRKLFCLVLVLAFVGMASAATNLLSNPGFEESDTSLNGWTTWDAVSFEGAWGTSFPGTATISEDTASGSCSVLINCNTVDGFAQQFGIYQVVNVPVGTEVALTGMWKGNLGGDGWAELKIATCAVGASFVLDGNKQYAAKIDTYGSGNSRPGGVWDWESTTLAPLSGNTIVSQGQVIVYTEMGGWGTASTLMLDDMMLEVVPEPMTIALLGLGAFGLIKRKK
ncbi:MAG TPA: PEP-CTERM sorting domain-containing protein [Sedimentisphaerales bacterium]|nr:PEP-CTERM sorting domain-containing protein [Sedimentisphaerales bacterium]